MTCVLRQLPEMSEMTDAPNFNEYDQPIGAALPDWKSRAQPPRAPIDGRYCRIEPIDVERHAKDLYEAYASAADGRDWTYMSGGRFRISTATTRTRPGWRRPATRCITRSSIGRRAGGGDIGAHAHRRGERRD